MKQFVFLICPSLLSILFLSFLNKSRSKTKNDFILFFMLLGSFCAINNFISLVLIRIIWNLDANTIIDYISIKYLFVALIISIITPFIFDLINKYLVVNIVVKNKEE